MIILILQLCVTLLDKPLEETGASDKFDIIVNVHGGGISGRYVQFVMVSPEL